MKIDKIRTLHFPVVSVYSLYDIKSEMLLTKECVYASVRRGLFPELNEAGISQRNRNVSFKPNALKCKYRLVGNSDSSSVCLI